MKAMLAENWDSRVSIHDYISDDRYIMEQKLDGHRVLIEVKGGLVVEVYERNGRRSQHYRRLTEPDWNTNFRPFASKSFILDGELINDTLHVFDMPVLEGVTQPDASHEKRKATLDKLFEVGNFNEHLQLVETARTKQTKTQLMVSCHNHGAEGVMIKDSGAPYTQGRTRHMLKVKYTKDGDFVVTRTNVNGKTNASLGAYDDAGNLVEVGRCSLIGKEDIETGDVVEVRYLYASDGMRLVQPRIKFKREDKHPTECLLSQIKPSDTKTVVTL